MSKSISHCERAYRFLHLALQLCAAAERELVLANSEASAPAVEVEPLVKLSSAQADEVHARSCACGDRAGCEAENGCDWSLVEPDVFRDAFGGIGVGDVR